VKFPFPCPGCEAAFAFSGLVMGEADLVALEYEMPFDVYLSFFCSSHKIRK